MLTTSDKLIMYWFCGIVQGVTEYFRPLLGSIVHSETVMWTGFNNISAVIVRTCIFLSCTQDCDVLIHKLWFCVNFNCTEWSAECRQLNKLFNSLSDINLQPECSFICQPCTEITEFDCNMSDKRFVKSTNIANCRQSYLIRCIRVSTCAFEITIQSFGF